MPDTHLCVASVTLKPGVFFVRTRSGGTLMDVLLDRYVALTPISAEIWLALVERQSTDEVVKRIMREKLCDFRHAEILLRQQLNRWKTAQLINSAAPSNVELPQPKPAPVRKADEIDIDRIARTRLSLALLGVLYAIELKYRHALRHLGLATTLVLLQHEKGGFVHDGERAMYRTLRSYHALRRLFKQGRTARDCLLRSLSLAACLRRQHIDADLCFGIIDSPFAAHAWVERNGTVLNEKLSTRQPYAVIGRF